MKICFENQVINKEGASKRRIFIHLSMPFMTYLKISFDNYLIIYKIFSNLRAVSAELSLLELCRVAKEVQCN